MSIKLRSSQTTTTQCERIFFHSVDTKFHLTDKEKSLGSAERLDPLRVTVTSLPYSEGTLGQRKATNAALPEK